MEYNKGIASISIILIIVGIFALGAGIYFFLADKTQGPVACTLEARLCPDGSTVGRTGPGCEFAPCPVIKTIFDPGNATYEIEGKKFTLVNGISETESAPGSVSKIVTRYFGNEAGGDLTGDGKPDIAFLITQDNGGSGIFYYAVVAIQTPDGYRLTNTLFIGDRIAPQSTNINRDSLELYVNYAERKPGEPMSAKPSVGVTKIFKITPEGTLNGLMQ